MILPVNASGLYSLSNVQLAAAILERRKAIREHRDAVGKFRSWVNDYKIWVFVMEIPGFPWFNPENDGKEIENFYCHRMSLTQDAPSSIVLKKFLWDIDLNKARRPALRSKLLQLQETIAWHYKSPILDNRPRNLDDDRILYRVLPENLSADFRLPDKDIYLQGSCVVAPTV